MAVSLAIGPLIDRVGVRPLIVWGAALSMAGAGLTAAAPSTGTVEELGVSEGGSVATGDTIAVIK